MKILNKFWFLATILVVEIIVNVEAQYSLTNLITAPIRTAAAYAERAVNDYASYSPTLNLLGYSGNRNRQTNQGNQYSLSNLANQAFTQLTGITYNNNVRPQSNNQYSRPVQYVNTPSLSNSNQLTYRPVQYVNPASNSNQVYTPVNNNNQDYTPINSNQVQQPTSQQSQGGQVTTARMESNLSYPIVIDIKSVSYVGKCSIDYPRMDWARIVTNLGSSHTLDLQMEHRLEFNCGDCGATGVKITSFKGNC